MKIYKVSKIVLKEKGLRLDCLLGTNGKKIKKKTLLSHRRNPTTESVSCTLAFDPPFIIPPNDDTRANTHLQIVGGGFGWLVG